MFPDPSVEAIARHVARVAMADIRSVRREMLETDAVRGFVGQRIRACLKEVRAE